MKNLGKLCIVFALVCWGVNTAKAQSSLKDDRAKKAAEVKGLVNNKDFVFEATHTKGEKALGYHKYDVAISKDTLIAYLPKSAGGVMKFDCKNFAYNTMRDNKGDWDITIKPNTKMSDVKELKLDVTPQGHASLQVVTHRGPLAFDGYIKQEDY
jgi:hypothetical protein